MALGYFITGTDTDVGKTYSTVKLIERWQRDGLSVAAMKPVASGCEVGPDGVWHNDDVMRLSDATGQTDFDLMNPYRFLPAISPHIAARQAGVGISLETILQHYQQLGQGRDLVVVEGAGGWFAPLSDQLFISDLAVALGLPVILVVGLRLGCINHALLTAQAIAASGLTLHGWVANHIDPGLNASAENLASLCLHLNAPLLLELPYQAD
jgi:dethiobiotin synthetase